MLVRNTINNEFYTVLHKNGNTCIIQDFYDKMLITLGTEWKLYNPKKKRVYRGRRRCKK